MSSLPFKECFICLTNNTILSAGDVVIRVLFEKGLELHVKSRDAVFFG